ncbi:MAG: glucosaminidase domain-containing protein [Treponema sp.]|nr:glucosaminidase domain-containing protein [Treponema sp.]
MKNLILIILVLFFAFSCVGLPPETENIAPQKPQAPIYIMSTGRVSAANLALFLMRNNPNLDEHYSHSLAIIYTEEAAFEGVNHDIAFVQMCLETGYLRFGGDVKPEQNNFAGLGAVGNGEPGLSFPDVRTGVRAQIQHLKAYGSQEPLRGELVNPRFRFVQRGISPTYEGLAGTWAVDRQYADKIKAILESLYDFSW